VPAIHRQRCAVDEPAVLTSNNSDAVNSSRSRGRFSGRRAMKFRRLSAAKKSAFIAVSK